MSQEMLTEFRQIVFTDKSLQEQLYKITERKEFISTVVNLGNARGYDFTAEEVEEAMNDATSAWLQRWI